MIGITTGKPKMARSVPFCFVFTEIADTNVNVIENPIQPIRL